MGARVLAPGGPSPYTGKGMDLELLNERLASLRGYL